MSALTGIELTAPALLMAGLAASPHCGMMCGAVAVTLGRGAGDAVPAQQRALLVNAGRVSGYALLGALAGGVGGMLLSGLPQAATGDPLRLLAAGALMVIGLLHWRRPRGHCSAPVRLVSSTPGLYARGLAWALLPCPLLYAVLALCMFSGQAVSGALLAAAFGIGTMPAMSAAVFAGGRFAGSSLRRTGGTLMIALGVLTVTAVLFPGSGVVLPWCQSPAT